MKKITCTKNRFTPKLILQIFVFQLFLFTTILQAQTQYNGCNLGGTSSSQTGYFGGFENGANNFGANASTDLNIVASGNLSSGQGKIGTNANSVSGGATLGPNSGSYMLLAHPKSNNDRLWYKTIAVTPGFTYEFCFYAANIKTNPASIALNVVMNGVIVTSQVVTTSQTNPSYTQICGQYTVPAGVTSMEIAITDPNAGNDGAQGKSHFLALDDLCFKQVTVFTLGNQVWYDANNNGVKDAGEPAIAGVAVNLYNGSGVFTGTSTTTDANGNYLFTNLITGNYGVGIVVPTGFANTVSSGTSNTTDNQNDGVAVAAGEIKTTIFSLTNSSVNIDFGLIGTGSIGNFVWSDINANGVQDFAEAGVSGVTVTLTGTNVFGNPVSLTTTTDANGAYLFSNLVAGTYTVSFGAPSGYNFSPQGNGTAATDSNPNSSGTSAAIVLAAGENNTTIDAGLFQYGSISDFVWSDSNANGVQDSGEAGISGVTVTLTGTNSLGNPVNLTTTTNSNGQYLFSNLFPGTYTVTVVAPSGYHYSPQGNGTAATDSNVNVGGSSGAFALSSGENNPTIDAGLFQYGSISNFVWSDTNANGVQDLGENGISGVSVHLTGVDAFDNTINLYATTDANGYYIFNNLVPSIYTVTFGSPSGYFFSPQGNGTAATDSNPSSAGLAPVITLASGENNTTIDAGLFQYGSIGDFVWNDTNANGAQDSGEAGIAGVTVTLTGTNAFGNPVNLTTTTGANGYYLFNNLIPGTYTVTFTKPNCYIASPVIGGVSNATNSDAVNGVVANIVLTSGQNISYVDAGYHLPAPPTVLCYQTATWNPISCEYDVTGTQPTAPTVLCYQTATWNANTCQYDVTGTQTAAPTVSFVDNCNGTWTITASGYTGSLLWNTGVTTPSITVTAAGTYSVSQLINGCSSQAATITVVKTCLVGDIYHTGTTCSDFNQGGNDRELEALCYSANNGKIGVVTPGVFFYFTAVVAPSANFTIKVTETKGNSSSANQYGLMAIHGSNQIVLWDPNCNKFSDAGIMSGSNNSQGSLTITNAVPGATYVLSVKYNPKSIQGNTYSGSVAPTVTYNFSTSVDNLNDGIANNYTVVANSQTSVDLVSGCSVDPVANATTTVARMTSSFTVYPVPFKDELNVKYNFENNSEVTIEIFDVRGVLLQTTKDANGYNEKEVKIDTSFSRVSGQVYLMRITTNQGTETKKIVSVKE